MGDGTGQPLAARRERSNATIPPTAADGIHLPTAVPTKTTVLHLPQERELTAANWGDGGSATYTSQDTDYQVMPFAGGGVDVNIVRRTIFAPEEFTFGLRVPEGTHLRQGVNVVLVETDAVPARPATTIATVSVLVARDAKGNPVQVSPMIHGDYVYQQSNLRLDLGPADVFSFPITLTLAYRASDISTSGALVPAWDGLPPGATIRPNLIAQPVNYVTDPTGSRRPEAVDPVVYAQRHSGRCQGGPDAYGTADGRSADFIASCQTQQLCLGSTPAQTSVDSCNNRLFANMSAQCVATFGETGDDYQNCIRVASDEVSWVKGNMLGGPG